VLQVFPHLIESQWVRFIKLVGSASPAATIARHPFPSEINGDLEGCKLYP
jgi:hypothetical protein